MRVNTLSANHIFYRFFCLSLCPTKNKFVRKMSIKAVRLAYMYIVQIKVVFAHLALWVTVAKHNFTTVQGGDK